MPAMEQTPTEQKEVPREPLKLMSDGSIKGMDQVLRAAGIREEAPVEETAPVEEKTEEAASPAPEKLKIKWDGKEIEVPKDDLVTLAQQGYDYTQKTQRLSEKERELAPLEGLAKQIQSDPRFAAHVYSYFQQPPQQPKVAEPPKDPGEKALWEFKNQILGEVQQMVQRVVTPLNQQEVINRTVMEAMRDPLYPKIHQEMVDYVKSLPPSIGKTVYMQLDQDPQAFMETFKQFRERLIEGQKKTEAPANATKTSKAPLLESSGTSEQPHVKEAQKKEKLSKAKAKLLASGDIAALSDWIRESGVADMLKAPR